MSLIFCFVVNKCAGVCPKKLSESFKFHLSVAHGNGPAEWEEVSIPDSPVAAVAADAAPDQVPSEIIILDFNSDEEKPPAKKSKGKNCMFSSLHPDKGQAWCDTPEDKKNLSSANLLRADGAPKAGNEELQKPAAAAIDGMLQAQQEALARDSEKKAELKGHTRSTAIAASSRQHHHLRLEEQHRAGDFIFKTPTGAHDPTPREVSQVQSPCEMAYDRGYVPEAISPVDHSQLCHGEVVNNTSQ